MNSHIIAGMLSFSREEYSSISSNHCCNSNCFFWNEKFIFICMNHTVWWTGSEQYCLSDLIRYNFKQLLCYFFLYYLWPSQNAAFSSSVNFVLKASSSNALRMADGEIIPGMFASVNVESGFQVDVQGNDGVLFEGRNAMSLQSRPGLAKIRIGKSRSITCSLKVVRSLTLKRKRIWSSFDFAPGILRQWLKQVNQRLIFLLTIWFSLQLYFN